MTETSAELSPKDIVSLQRNATHRLELRIVGRDEPYEDVRVARCFPWSFPGAYISLRSSDDKEILLIADLGDLNEEVRDLIEEELRDKVFNPQIRKILRHSSEFGVITIAAETDRGEVEFQIPSRDNIRMLSSVRALLRDAEGNTYEIADLTELDPASQKFLHEYL